MGGNTFASKIQEKARDLGHFVHSRRAISVYKGTVAYIIGFSLIFLRKFESLSFYPTTLQSMVILIIVGGPGKSVGSSILAVAFGLLGAGLGSIGFLILAHLNYSHTAQGFIFAMIMYTFALVKARGFKFFPLALLAILMSFNGIYTSLNTGGFDARYLEEYLKTYCWGSVIILAVNFFVFPLTSEKEIRQTLITSLEHISESLHLLAKGYTFELTDEERVTRDLLAQRLRQDFSTLNQKIDDTFVEINFSRHSTKDYQCFITRIRRIQQNLITAHSSILSVEERDTELFRSIFLPNANKTFSLLREALDITMHEIITDLECHSFHGSEISVEFADDPYLQNHPSESRVDQRHLSSGLTTRANSIDERLHSVTSRLEDLEVHNHDDVSERTDHHTTHSSRLSIPFHLTRTRSPPTASPTLTPSAQIENSPEHHGLPIPAVSKQDLSFEHKPGLCVKVLRRVFDRFCTEQHNILVQCLVDGHLHGADDSLRILDPRPSVKETYQYKYVPSLLSGDDLRRSVNRARRRRRTWMDENTDDKPPATPPGTPASPPENSREVFYEIIREKNDFEEKSDQVTIASHHSLTRVYSFLFAMEQLVTEVELLYHSVKRVAKKDKGIKFHYFPSLNLPDRENGYINSSSRKLKTELKNSEFSDIVSDLESPRQAFEEMSVSEALALLEHRKYTPVRLTISQRLAKIEQWLRGPSSIYAAKVAAAASVFSILLFLPVTRDWFISYGVAGGILTITTSLQPTLGQSVTTFVFQILGSGIGFVWALTLLMMARHVGGYNFNPFVIISLLAPYSLIFFYLLYHKPQYLVAAILALNATGTVLITEWINVEYYGISDFDPPVLRFGKAFTTLGVALGIVGTFQLFILRNPAKRDLRKRIGKLLFAQLSYLTLLQAFVRGVLPPDPSRRAPQVAIVRVAEELRHRELKIQAELIALRPVVGYAANEAQFGQPFKEDVMKKILRTGQILLDRMRESRIAISLEPLPDSVLKNYVQVLAPYRRRNSQIQQLTYYLVASSILAKAPLLRETPAELESESQVTNFMHDMLVLASRHARTSEGAQTIRSGSFTRYFHYLVSLTSLNEHLKVLEEACRDLFGELEDHLE